MDQGGPSKGDDLGRRQPVEATGFGGEVGDAPRVSHQVRGLEVGEVGDRLEGVLELLLGDDGLERRLGSQHGVPAGRSIEVAEEHRRLVAEDVHQRGVELGAGSIPRHRDGGVDAIGAVVDLDHVGQRHEARREQDLVLLQAEGRVLPVPSLEGLFDASSFAMPPPSRDATPTCSGSTGKR